MSGYVPPQLIAIAGYKMRVWVLGLKRAFDQDQEPQREDPAPDLMMAGSE